MPSVPLRALLMYNQSLLRVCPPGRTLGNNIIGLTNIACGHDQAPFAQGEKWFLARTSSLNSYDYGVWCGLIKIDHSMFTDISLGAGSFSISTYVALWTSLGARGEAALPRREPTAGPWWRRRSSHSRL
jgi:hypothetical protein